MTRIPGGVIFDKESVNSINETNETISDIDSRFETFGSAKSATKLYTKRKIGKASFDGADDISLEDIGAEESGVAEKYTDSKVGDLSTVNIDDNTKKSTLVTIINYIINLITTHSNNKDNPHGVTKGQIGLGNVDNTADADKSVKYATTSGSANAVAWSKVTGKPNTYPPSTHTHSVTKADVGLGNVDNTADADKPISTAQQAALNKKQNEITGAAITCTTSKLTESRAVITSSNGNIGVSAVTSKELGYLDGVTSNIQTQLNSKAASSHTHSYLSTSGGTVSDHITIKRTGDTGTGYFLNLNRDGKQIWKIGITDEYELKIGDFGTGDHVTTPVTLSKINHAFGSNHEITRDTYLRGSNVRIYAHTGGTVYLGYTGSTAVTSDENLKNLYDISDNYDIFFDSLIPKLYKYKKDGCHRYHIGFGARQVEEALYNAELSTEDFAGILIDKDVTMMADEAGTEEDVHYDELYSLRYEEFISLNTWQIQKLKTKISEQQKEIDELKNEVSSLKELISTQNNTELD